MDDDDDIIEEEAPGGRQEEEQDVPPPQPKEDKKEQPLYVPKKPPPPPPRPVPPPEFMVSRQFAKNGFMYGNLYFNRKLICHTFEYLDSAYLLGMCRSLLDGVYAVYYDPEWEHNKPEGVSPIEIRETNADEIHWECALKSKIHNGFGAITLCTDFDLVNMPQYKEEALLKVKQTIIDDPYFKKVRGTKKVILHIYDHLYDHLHAQQAS